ncbi:50S ribosomal protein L4 [archaeon]|nr:50S ribosomal protein L4 [archaeon]
MKAQVKGMDGAKIKEVNLPKQFSEEFRPDLIKKAVLVIQSHNIQPYGAYTRAGLGYSSMVSKRRKHYKTTYGHGNARTPRKVLTRRGLHFYFQGATVPNTVGGRRAHPPKAEKIWDEKININERRKAIRSAIAATMVPTLVKKRGHTTESIVLDSKVEDMKKTKDVYNLLVKLMPEEMKRVEYKKVRAGKGKNRGRKYKFKKGPLIVVADKCELIKSATNLQGIDICIVKELNSELLAPGCDAGRLTIWTDKSLELMEKEKLFFKKIKKVKKE